MKYATVVFFNRQRGWGFAMPDSGLENDVFLHVSNLPADRRFLFDGERICYELGEHDGKPLALNIRIVAPPPRDSTSESADALALLGECEPPEEAVRQ